MNTNKAFPRQQTKSKPADSFVPSARPMQPPKVSTFELAATRLRQLPETDRETVESLRQWVEAGRRVTCEPGDSVDRLLLAFPQYFRATRSERGQIIYQQPHISLAQLRYQESLIEQEGSN